VQIDSSVGSSEQFRGDPNGASIACRIEMRNHDLRGGCDAVPVIQVLRGIKATIHFELDARAAPELAVIRYPILGYLAEVVLAAVAKWRGFLGDQEHAAIGQIRGNVDDMVLESLSLIAG
jgi:hypothetical protein